jgi:hypothetical protein
LKLRLQLRPTKNVEAMVRTNRKMLSQGPAFVRILSMAPMEKAIRGRLGSALELMELRHQLVPGLLVIGIGDAGVDGADRRALGFFEMSDALGALPGIDEVALFTCRDGLVGTLGLACAAVDAFLGDDESHRVPPQKLQVHYNPIVRVFKGTPYLATPSRPTFRDAS